jgi:hypothetical protein
LLNRLTRLIIRAIVNQQDFMMNAFESLPYAVDDPLNGRLLVVDGDDDGKQWPSFL